MPDKAQHMPTLRVTKMLKTISDSPHGLTLTEITEQNNMPKSSLFPIAHTLVEEGFLNYDSATAKFTLGLELFEIGNKFLNQFDIMEYIKQQMDSIVSICNETCHFAVLSGGDVLYIHKVDSREPIRMYSSVGKRLPAYGTGLGKALLCSHSLPELQKLYPDGLKPLTENTITDIRCLEEQLKTIRSNGVAFEKEESNLHVQCIAVPLLKDGKPLAALSVAIPVFRASQEHLDLIEKLLVGTRKNIEQVLATMDFPLESLI